MPKSSQPSKKKLEELYRTSASWQEVAEKLEMPVSTVKQKARQLGIRSRTQPSQRRYTDAEVEEIFTRFQKTSLRAVAAELGTSPQAVQSLLKRRLGDRYQKVAEKHRAG
jgi:hypothetical protein